MKSMVRKMTITRNISLRLEPRCDGGIRIWSPQVPGLILSGSDPAKVMADVWPALTALEEYRAGKVATLKALKTSQRT